MADKGYAIPRETIETSTSASELDFIQDYVDSPIENRRDALLYITEQVNNSLWVEVTVKFGGGMHLLRAKLPSIIRRNEIYTLKIHGKGAEMQLVIASEGWNMGASVESKPSINGLVDVENSIFSEGVRVNETKDTVFVPFFLGSVITILILCPY